MIDTNKTAYEQIYIFCLMWSFGAFLETHDRNRFEVYLQKHTKLKMPSLPEGESIFNYNVNVHTGQWSHWNELIKDYQPPEITPQTYSSLLIPNVSSIRTDYLIDLAVKQGASVLLMGEQGSAKTSMINAHIKKYNAEIHVMMSSNFSSTTTPQLFQKQVGIHVLLNVGQFR